MMQQPPKQLHWRDRAIAHSDIISDALEVAKAYGARVAEWVLVICLVANILELLPFFSNLFGDVIVIIQSITLDIAGFGLTSMGNHARRRGDEQAARTASRMGWTLIGLMILTVIVVAVPQELKGHIPAQQFTQLNNTLQWVDIALIFLRLIVTVFYSHIVHGLRQGSMEHENELSTLQERASTLQQEVSTLQRQLSTGQRTVDTLRGQLREKEQEVDTLRGQVDSGQQALENVHGHLRNKEAELTGGQSAMDSFRRQLEMRVQEVDALSGQVQERQEQVSSLQTHVSTLEQEVSRLRGQVDRGKRGQVDSGHPHSVDSGQKSGHRSVDGGQVISLDAKKRGRDAADNVLDEQIREVLREEPGLSDRAIASRLSCSPTTVGKRRKLIEREVQGYANG